MGRLQDIQSVLEGNKRRPSNSSKAGVMALGAVVGATAGVLLAPHSGKVTRAKIKQKTKSGLDSTKNKAEEVKEGTKDKAEEVRDKAIDKAKDTKEAASDAASETKRASRNNRLSSGS